MPFALLVFLAFDGLALRAPPRRIGGGAALVGLALIRTEGIAWALTVLAAAAAANRRRHVALVPAAAILAIGWAAYSAWHYAYFGDLVANTVRAKVGENLSPEGWLRGVRYVGASVLAFVSPVLLAPATVAAFRYRRRPAGPAVAAMAWAFPIYAILVTGDYMPMGRLLVPGLAFQTILVAWLLEDLPRGAARPALALGASALAVLPAWNVHAVPEAIRAASQFRRGPLSPEATMTEYEFWARGNELLRSWTAKGKALRRYVAQRPFPGDAPACVTGTLGCVGYYSGLELLDRQGLVTPSVLAGSKRRPPGESSPGHEHGVSPLFFAEREPEILRAEIVATAEPCSVRAACARWAEALRLSATDSRYVVDAFPVAEGEPGDAATLLLWRRIDGAPSAAWRGFSARQDSLERLGACPPDGPPLDVGYQ
jgi:hypothetical protein